MSDNFWGSLILYATAGLVWLGGEAGRAGATAAARYASGLMGRKTNQRCTHPPAGSPLQLFNANENYLINFIGHHGNK